MKEYLQTWPPLVFLRELAEDFFWRAKGKTGGASHRQKQAVISSFRKKFSLEILVETGTYLGEMINAKKNEFAEVYSIELAHQLFVRAKNRFTSYSHVTIIEGDSARVLAELPVRLNRPVLFWLDGHYSGGETARAEQDTPVSREVRIIFEKLSQPFVILIDDARLFAGQNGYPTLEELRRLVYGMGRGYQMEVGDDIIRIFSK